MFNNQPNNMGLWNPSTDISKPLPMVYRIVKIKNEWTIEPYISKFIMPPKLYGDMPKHAKRIWTSFNNREGSLGVLLAGLKGSGKTETSMLLCNIAIENGMSVIMVSEVRPDLKLIKFLSDLNNVVLFIDEYGKQFMGNIQDKSLTMFSDIADNKKLFILTENELYLINRFLLNRPGRVWYLIKYGRLADKVVDEYCKDHHVRDTFLEEFLIGYKQSKEFTFDHLKAIVQEHLDYPNENFKDLVEIMNIEIGNNNMVHKIISIRPIDNPEINLIPAKRKYHILNNDNDNYIDINTMVVKVIDIDGNSLTEDKQYSKYMIPISIRHNTPVDNIKGDTTVYKVNQLLVAVKKQEDDGSPEEQYGHGLTSNSNNRGFGNLNFN